MKKLTVFLCLMLSIFSSIYSFDIPVYASDSYTISNDGKEKGENDIYKDSGLPSSFEGAEYYDVAMPYNLTAFDVGGWCYDAANKAYVLPESKLKKIKISANTCTEYGFSRSLKELNSGWGTPSKDKDTGCTVVEKNGVKFFIMAVQKYQYNTDTANKWFGGFNSNSNGYLIDVILTDGTVIHFIKGDSNAPQHTNGGASGKGQDKATDKNPNYVGQWWAFKPAKLKQYANIYGLSSCNSIEIWGDGNKFAKHFNLGSGDNQNRIAYYRIYNVKVGSNFKPVSNDVKSVSYKLGNVKITSSGSGGKSTVSEGVNLKQTGKYVESDFVNVDYLIESDIELPDQENITDKQLKDVIEWKKNVEYEKEDVIIKFLRTVVMFCGIIFIVWMLLIYLCYWMDRINNIIDVAFLPIVTFGRLRVSPEEFECTFNPKDFSKGQAQTVNHRVVLSICLIGVFFAVLIITGNLYKLINFVIRWIFKLLGFTR